MAPRGNRGYTLLEVSIVVALMSGLFLMSANVMIRSLQVVATQNVYADVSEALRTVSLATANELTAAILDDLPGKNIVKGLSIPGGSASTVTFQRPLDLGALSFTNPTILRVRNEDANGNLKLDKGEDLDGNGILDRVYECVEDKNNDGKYTAVGETRILARNVDSITFKRAAGSHKITATVTARSGMNVAGVSRILQKQHEFTVFVRN